MCVLRTRADTEAAVAAEVPLAEHGVEAEARAALDEVDTVEAGVAAEVVDRGGVVVLVVLLVGAGVDVLEELRVLVVERPDLGLDAVRVGVVLTGSDAAARQDVGVDVEGLLELLHHGTVELGGDQLLVDLDRGGRVDGVPAEGVDEAPAGIVPAVVPRLAELDGLVTTAELEVTLARRDGLALLGGGGDVRGTRHRYSFVVGETA